MVVRLAVFVAVMAAAVGAVAAPTEVRAWTDTDGRQIQARALSYDGDLVVLELANGERRTFHVSSFSARDREYLEQHFRGGRKAFPFPATTIVLFVLAWILSTWGRVWLLVVAFHTSTQWGVLCLLAPCFDLIFLITHWQDAKKPFGLQVLGFAMFLIGAAVVVKARLGT